MIAHIRDNYLVALEETLFHLNFVEIRDTGKNAGLEGPLVAQDKYFLPAFAVNEGAVGQFEHVLFAICDDKGFNAPVGHQGGMRRLVEMNDDMNGAILNRGPDGAQATG